MLKKIIMIASFLILAGCSKQPHLKIIKPKIPIFNCDNNFTIKAKEVKYNYIVPKKDFEKIIKKYSRCVKICKYYSKVLSSK